MRFASHLSRSINEVHHAWRTAKATNANPQLIGSLERAYNELGRLHDEVDKHTEGRR